MEAAKVIFGLILLFSPFVTIIIFAIRYQKRMFVRAFDNVGEVFRENSVTLRSQVPDNKAVLLRVSGEKNDCNIHVFSEYVGSGKNRALITKIEINGLSTSIDFTLYKENVFTKLGEALGMQDVKTGDEEFDKVYRLKSSKPAEVLKLFTDKIRSEFLTERKNFTGTLSVKNNKLIHTSNLSPGQKIGLRLFKSCFMLAMLFTQKSIRMSGGHSPVSH